MMNKIPGPRSLVSLTGVSRQLRVPLSRLHSLVRSGEIHPDFVVADTKLQLFWGRSIPEIETKLSQKALLS